MGESTSAIPPPTCMHNLTLTMLAEQPADLNTQLDTTCSLRPLPVVPLLLPSSRVLSQAHVALTKYLARLAELEDAETDARTHTTAAQQQHWERLQLLDACGRHELIELGARQSLGAMAVQQWFGIVQAHWHGLEHVARHEVEEVCCMRAVLSSPILQRCCFFPWGFIEWVQYVCVCALCVPYVCTVHVVSA